jgi:hypothetical protein
VTLLTACRGLARRNVREEVIILLGKVALRVRLVLTVHRLNPTLR